MSLRDKVTSGAFWISVQSFGGQSVSFLVFLVLARLLTPDSFGLIAIATVFVSIISTLSKMGLQPAIVQVENLLPGHLSGAFFLSLGISALLYLLLLLAAPLLAGLFNEPELGLILPVLGIVSVLNSTAVVPTGILTRGFRFKQLAVYGIIAMAIGGAIGILLALVGFGAWALVAQQLATAAITAVLLWSGSRWLPSLVFDWRELRQLMRFSLDMLGNTLLVLVNQQSDNLIIGSYLGTATLGIYAVAQKIYRALIRLFLVPINNLALPLFSRMQNHDQRLEAAYYEAVAFSTALSFPVCLLVLLTSDTLVSLLVGPKWQASAAILQYLLIGIFTAGLAAINNSVLIALGRTRVVLKLGVFATLTNVLFMLVALKWGVEAIAIALTVSKILMMPIRQYMVTLHTQISFSAVLAKVRAPLAGVVSILLLGPLCNLLFLGLESWQIICFQWGLSLVLYALVVFVVDRALASNVVTLGLQVIKR